MAVANILDHGSYEGSQGLFDIVAGSRGHFLSVGSLLFMFAVGFGGFGVWGMGQGSEPGKPVAHNHGFLSIKEGLLWGCSGLLLWTTSRSPGKRPGPPNVF